MSAEKSLAVVLRVTEFSESSCIVSLLTREFGKITAIAKGARRPKSPFDAALDVLAICRIVFLHKTTAMSLLTEAKLERRFRSGETNLAKLYSGFYIVELLRNLTDEGDPLPELFDLTMDWIERLDSDALPDDQLDIQRLRFELRMLDILGHLPMLTRCVSCGQEKTALTRVNFGLNAGGILCGECRRGQTNIVSVSESGFGWLLRLVGGQIGSQQNNSDNWNQNNLTRESRWNATAWTSNPAADAIEDDAVTLQSENEPNPTGIRTAPNSNRLSSADSQDKTSLREVRQLINQYMTHLIGHPPRLHKFISQL